MSDFSSTWTHELLTPFSQQLSHIMSGYLIMSQLNPHHALAGLLKPCKLEKIISANARAILK